MRLLNPNVHPLQGGKGSYFIYGIEIPGSGIEPAHSQKPASLCLFQELIPYLSVKDTPHVGRVIIEEWQFEELELLKIFGKSSQ